MRRPHRSERRSHFSDWAIVRELRGRETTKSVAERELAESQTCARDTLVVVSLVLSLRMLTREAPIEVIRHRNYVETPLR
jgi:hypothetical protein